MVGGFVGFVDDDEPEVLDGREEGGTGSDDDLGLIVLKDILPGEVAGGFGLLAVEEGDVGEVLLEVLD